VVDEFDHLLVESATLDQPGWPIAAEKIDMGPKGGRRKSISNLVKPPSAWRLRLVTVDPQLLVLAKDTEKDERFKKIKKKWEEEESGRAAKAKEARDAYLKQAENGQVKPVYVKLPTGQFVKPYTNFDERGEVVKNTLKKSNLDKFDLRKVSNLNDVGLQPDQDYILFKGLIPVGRGPVVLTDEEQEQRRKTREEMLKETDKLMERIQAFRDNMADRSKRMNEHYQSKWDAISKLQETYKEEDHEMRENYRKIVAKRLEAEALRKAEEANKSPVVEEIPAAAPRASAKKR
jgi:hypothetical protein